MGFRTLSIQKHASKVWEVLGDVKTEFDKFGAALAGVKKKLEEAGKQIDETERRTRVLTRKLSTVETTGGTQSILGVDDNGEQNSLGI